MGIGAHFSQKPSEILDAEIDDLRLCVPSTTRHPSWSSRSGYKMGWILGEGAFGCVRIAWSNKNGSKFVIKDINLDLVLPDSKICIDNEMNILSQLQHPHIVQLIEVFVYKSNRYLVMEHLGGGELFDSICAREYYYESDARRVVAEILSALQYLHSHGVMHRDLKPENLMMVSSAHSAAVKLIDFGACAALPAGRALPCDLQGTLPYCAPEMLAGVPYAFGVDMWSLGVVLYVMLSGTDCFMSTTRERMLSEVTAWQGIFPNKYFGNVSPLAKEFLSELMERDPVRRLSANAALQHPWVTESRATTHRGNMAIQLDNLRSLTAAKKLRTSVTVLNATRKFKTLTKRKKCRAILNAAKSARQLQESGISWQLTPLEIESVEEMRNKEPTFQRSDTEETDVYQEATSNSTKLCV